MKNEVACCRTFRHSVPSNELKRWKDLLVCKTDGECVVSLANDINFESIRTLISTSDEETLIYRLVIFLHRQLERVDNLDFASILRAEQCSNNFQSKASSANSRLIASSLNMSDIDIPKGRLVFFWSFSRVRCSDMLSIGRGCLRVRYFRIRR